MVLCMLGKYSTTELHPQPKNFVCRSKLEEEGVGAFSAGFSVFLTFSVLAVSFLTETSPRSLWHRKGNTEVLPALSLPEPQSDRCYFSFPLQGG